MSELMIERRGIERKGVVVEVKDADSGAIRAVFSTMNCKDKDNDWTLPGAFDQGADVVIGAYGHRTVLDGALPVGKGVIGEYGDEAVLDGKFFLETQSGRETFAVMKALGPRQEWSYEFKITKTGQLTDDLRKQGVRRVIEKVHVFGVAPVLQGAGANTRTLLAKAVGEARAKELTDDDEINAHLDRRFKHGLR